MFIADRIIAIHDKEDSIVSYEMIEKLDQMLNEYNVPHAFSLYFADHQDTDVAFNLYYEEKDEMTLDLVLMHWAKLERKFNDEKISEMMRRASQRFGK